MAANIGRELREIRVALALLRTLALNLLRCKGFRSIRAGPMAVAHEIHRMLSWVGVSPVEAHCGGTRHGNRAGTGRTW